MAYECEENIKYVIKDLVYFKNDKDELANKEIDEVYNKAKAFDTFIKYVQHVEKYDNSDANELTNIFESVMREYMEEVEEK